MDDTTFQSDMIRSVNSSSRWNAENAARQAEMELHRDGDLAEGLSSFLNQRARLEVVAILQEWAEGVADAERSMAQDLVGLLSGAVDRNGDGLLDDAEAIVFDRYVEAAWAYMAALGVTETDFALIVDGLDDEAAFRVATLLAEEMPGYDTEDAIAEMCEFSMSADADDVAFDAAQPSRGWSWARRHRGKETAHSRHGKRKLTGHRAKWRKATAMQMAALRKARSRAHTALATTLNRKSNLLTRKRGGRKVV